MIENYTEKQLKDELNRRKEEKELIEKEKRVEMIKKVLKHKHVLVEFMKHNRSSCKTSNNANYHPEHGGASCHLCCLDDLSEYDDDVEIFVDVILTRVEEK